MKKTNIEEKLSVNKYDIDKEVYIRLREDLCSSCVTHSCVFACPAGCFNLKENRLNFSYEGCLECGACQIVCEKEAIDWTLPRAGFGICYLYG